MEKFKACYEVEDGYCGKSRPKYFNINADEIGDGMSENDLSDLYDSSMYDAFEQQITTYGKNREAFIEWAKSQQNKG